MTNQTFAKPQPLLPSDRAKDSPLFVVLSILAFLSTLTLLSLSASYLSSTQWSADLENTATLQIKPSTREDEVSQPARAKEILLTLKSVLHVDILPRDHSKTLLRPWLGEATLPNDLALPIILHIQLNPNQKLEVKELTAALKHFGIRSDIDNHSHWTKELETRARAVQLLSILAFFLISLAIISASVFAIRAGITAQKTLMDVLFQVGARPQYTARLFSLRFAMNGFKAGCFGALAALILLFLFGLIFKAAGYGLFFLPEFTFGLNNIYLAVFVPVLMALISGLAAWHTVMKSLISEMYP